MLKGMTPKAVFAYTGLFGFLLLLTVLFVVFIPKSPESAESQPNSYPVHIVPMEKEPIATQVFWEPVAYSPDGLVFEGFRVEHDPVRPEQAAIFVPETLSGDIVMFASYLSKNHRVVSYRPFLVARRGKMDIKDIRLPVGIETLKEGQRVELFEMVGVNEKGGFFPLFIPMDADIGLVSSNPDVVAVADRTTLLAQKEGTSEIKAQYAGFEASITVTVAKETMPSQDKQP